MKTLIITLVLVFAPAVIAQDACNAPAGYVCITQELANKLFDTTERLIKAQEVIDKLKISSQTGDVALAQSLLVIKKYEDLEVINGKIIVAYDKILALYERVITMYQGLVERLEKQMNKPRSAWQKFLRALKDAALVVGGVLVGRGLSL